MRRAELWMRCMNEKFDNIRWNQNEEQSNKLNESQSYFMIKYNIHLSLNK